MWTTLSPAETKKLIANVGVRSSGFHAFTRKISHWSFCARCGLVLLRNAASRKAANAACVIYLDN